MVLTKTTIDNSVRYVPITEKTKDNKQFMLKNKKTK